MPPQECAVSSHMVSLIINFVLLQLVCLDDEAVLLIHRYVNSPTTNQSADG